MNHLYRITLTIGMTALLAVPISIIGQARPAMPAVNEAEMKQLEAEMAAFQKEIDALSPTEQEAFFKSMEEAVQKIDNLSKTPEGKALLDKLDRGELSDEELDNLINQIVEEPSKPEPVAPPITVKSEVVEKPEPKPVISSKHQIAADVIQDMIRHTNSFIVKMAATHELPGKIKNWRKKGYISWNQNLTLNKLKADIEKFGQQLNTLLEKDRKTKAYIHLDNLLASESLYNNLKKAHRVIVDQEPKIEEAIPFSNKMSVSSKKSFQKTINQYIEALYTLALPQEIKQLISKFDATAKTLSDQEDAARKAADAAHRRLSPGAPIIAGSRDTGYMPSGREYDDTSYSPGRYSSPRSYGESYRPEYVGHSPTERMSSGQGGSSAAARGGGSGGSAQEADAKKEKENPLDTMLKHANEMDKKLLADADKLFKKISVNIESAADTIKASTILSDIRGHLVSDGQVDIEFATEELPELVRELSLRKGAIGNIQQMESKLPPAALNGYKKKLQELFEKYKKQFEPLFDQLTKIEVEWDTLSNTISPAKKYAYFAPEQEAEKEQPELNVDELLAQAEQKSQSIEDGLKKAVEATESQVRVEDSKLQEIKRKVPTPYSLKELQNNLRSLKSAIENFGSSKLKPKSTKRKR